jgi:selenide,water dikinase
MDIKLTEFSHGAGCGCKIAPKVLDEILRSESEGINDINLLVGNDTRDDAAVYGIDKDRAIISTTDFFMPIVDDPFNFGSIAAVNAISDIYAMGGQPLMAISILGWPIDKLSAEIAGQVVEGARQICAKAGIPLAGGHSIDSIEPIFGLAVTGIVDRKNIKTNDKAVPGCELFLTKPLGIGIVTTAQKKKIVKKEDLDHAVNLMLTLNDEGIELGRLPGVLAMTDVTGFGLLGHLIEICEASEVSAEIDFSKVPTISGIDQYIEQYAIPGGTHRNFSSYGHKVSPLSDIQKMILCDPQTSGGLLVVVDPEHKKDFLRLLKNKGLTLQSFGRIKSWDSNIVKVN